VEEGAVFLFLHLEIGSEVVVGLGLVVQLAIGRGEAVGDLFVLRSGSCGFLVEIEGCQGIACLLVGPPEIEDRLLVALVDLVGFPQVVNGFAIMVPRYAMMPASRSISGSSGA